MIQRMKVADNRMKHMFCIPLEAWQFIHNTRKKKSIIIGGKICHADNFRPKTMEYYSGKVLTHHPKKYILICVDKKMIGYLKKCQRKYKQPLWVCFVSSIGFEPEGVKE